MDKNFGEIRVVDEKTGGAKGSKIEQLAWAPPEAMLELGKVYGVGARKYNPVNYRFGYNWSLSAHALQRHYWRWVGGESIDPETGCHHLAHLAWHALTLIIFERRKLGTDDVRWPTLNKND